MREFCVGYGRPPLFDRTYVGNMTFGSSTVYHYQHPDPTFAMMTSLGM
jgi:hypothetical protein